MPLVVRSAEPILDTLRLTTPPAAATTKGCDPSGAGAGLVVSGICLQRTVDDGLLALIVASPLPWCEAPLGGSTRSHLWMTLLSDTAGSTLPFGMEALPRPSSCLLPPAFWTENYGLPTYPATRQLPAISGLVTGWAGSAAGVAFVGTSRDHGALVLVRTIGNHSMPFSDVVAVLPLPGAMQPLCIARVHKDPPTVRLERRQNDRRGDVARFTKHVLLPSVLTTERNAPFYERYAVGTATVGVVLVRVDFGWGASHCVAPRVVVLAVAGDPVCPGTSPVARIVTRQSSSHTTAAGGRLGEVAWNCWSQPTLWYHTDLEFADGVQPAKNCPSVRPGEGAPYPIDAVFAHAAAVRSVVSSEEDDATTVPSLRFRAHLSGDDASTPSAKAVFRRRGAVVVESILLPKCQQQLAAHKQLPRHPLLQIPVRSTLLGVHTLKVFKLPAAPGGGGTRDASRGAAALGGARLIAACSVAGEVAVVLVAPHQLPSLAAHAVLLPPRAAGGPSSLLGEAASDGEKPRRRGRPSARSAKDELRDDSLAGWLHASDPDALLGQCVLSCDFFLQLTSPASRTDGAVELVTTSPSRPTQQPTGGSQKRRIPEKHWVAGELTCLVAHANSNPATTDHAVAQVSRLRLKLFVGESSIDCPDSNFTVKKSTDRKRTRAKTPSDSSSTSATISTEGSDDDEESASDAST